MKVTYRSDSACPYCYIGETRLKNAAKAAGVADELELEMRAFELNPEAPHEVVGPTLDRFAAKYGLTKEQAAERIAGISQMGCGEGIDFNYATTLNTNMLDAHRLTKLAHDKGVEGIEELLYAAYFTNNEVLADHGVLRRIAGEVGLDATDVERVVESAEYEAEVRAEARAAYALGVHAVPFFVVDGKYAIQGCYPTDEMERVLEKAKADGLAEGAAEGMSCGPDGCAF